VQHPLPRLFLLVHPLSLLPLHPLPLLVQALPVLPQAQRPLLAPLQHPLPLRACCRQACSID
jgi:hypothetical protein